MRALLTLALLSATPVTAQAVMPCDWQANAQALVEPWEETSRQFANGAVRVALLDTIEPAAGAFYLLVLSPPYDDVGGRQCKVIGAAPGIGFAGLDFGALASGYDPARGLTLQMPVTLFMPEDGTTRATLLNVTVNQSTGNVIAQ
jgi:hypothetical protein